MQHWATDSIFYHIYPFGFCAAPKANDFHSPAVHRLEKVYVWLDHIQQLGCNALYLGPLFESSSHGYDTVDYYHVDRRLGNNETLARLSEEIHRRGMRLILDAVFNHVGRDFWAFSDLRQHGESSPYRSWFYNLRFGEKSPYDDPFHYEGWGGYHSLVKLDPKNTEVKEHLFSAVKTWMEDFGIDGLRLDAADCIDLGFLRELSAFCRGLRPDFWLMGEVVHDDYRHWVNPETLDSVTNYECYKGLFSSLNDSNYFEIAYALKRQFGQDGVYAGLPLYNFTDNHDVNRVASRLDDPAHLYPLYCLLFSMPGIPSIYYGSEWGIQGERTAHDDSPLRPSLALEQLSQANDFHLMPAIRRLADIRHHSPALKYGSYRELHVSHQQLAFLRESGENVVVVILNASAEPVPLALSLPGIGQAALVDLLNPGGCFSVQNGAVMIEEIPARWARILQLNP